MSEAANMFVLPIEEKAYCKHGQALQNALLSLSIGHEQLSSTRTASAQASGRGGKGRQREGRRGEEGGVLSSAQTSALVGPKEAAKGAANKAVDARARPKAT